MFTLLPKGVQTKLLKFFCFKDFSICHRCQRHRWQTLNCEYLRKFSQKIRNDPNGIIRGLGNLIQEKNQKQKNSWHSPFKLHVYLKPAWILNVFREYCLLICKEMSLYTDVTSIEISVFLSICLKRSNFSFDKLCNNEIFWRNSANYCALHDPVFAKNRYISNKNKI